MSSSDRPNDSDSRPLLVMIAGPVGKFRGLPDHEIETNLGAIRSVAVEVWRRGHVPVVGVHEAYPLLDYLDEGEDPAAMVQVVSLGLARRCDAIIVLGSSASVDEEIRQVLEAGGQLLAGLAELPDLRNRPPSLS